MPFLRCFHFPLDLATYATLSLVFLTKVKSLEVRLLNASFAYLPIAIDSGILN